jgi:hypothetical protein
VAHQGWTQDRQRVRQEVRPAERRVQLVTRRVEQPAQQEVRPAEQRVQLVMRRVEQPMQQEVQPVEQRVQQEVQPAERRVQQEVRPAELSEQLVTRRVEQLAQQEMRPAELSEQPVTRRVVSQAVLHGAARVVQVLVRETHQLLLLRLPRMKSAREQWRAYLRGSSRQNPAEGQSDLGWRMFLNLARCTVPRRH